MLRGTVLAAAMSAVMVGACGGDTDTLTGGRRSSTSSSGAGTGAGTTSPSGDTGTRGSTGTTTDGSTPAEICVATINEYRATKNLPRYARWDAAESCTDAQAKSDGSTSAAHGAFGKCGES